MQFTTEQQQYIDEYYQLLPVDADGVPIHLGDMVEGELLFDNATVKGTVTTYHIHDDGEPGTVYIKVKPTEDTWTIKKLWFTRCRHVKPRTIEDVLREFAEKAVCGNQYGSLYADEEEIAKYADELRGMMEVDA